MATHRDSTLRHSRLRRDAGRPSLRAPGEVATLVATLYAQLIGLLRERTQPLPDRRSDELTAEVFEATVQISNAPAECAADIDLKLAVLCGRLREHLHPEHHGELVSYLLAESIREDCQIWRVMADTGGQP